MSIGYLCIVEDYLEAALWADKPEDENWDDADWAPETITKAEADCRSFCKKAGKIIEDLGDHYPFGHDFWLTRQGHGAGFWDGDYPEPQASQLTKLSKEFGETDIYLGDSGLIYFA